MGQSSAGIIPACFILRGVEQLPISSRHITGLISLDDPLDGNPQHSSSIPGPLSSLFAITPSDNISLSFTLSLHYWTCPFLEHTSPSDFSQHQWDEFRYELLRETQTPQHLSLTFSARHNTRSHIKGQVMGKPGWNRPILRPGAYKRG